MFGQTLSNGKFTGKRYLLGPLERSTWQNSTHKNYTTRDDFMTIATYLDSHCDRHVGNAVPEGHVLEVLYSIIGPNCERGHGYGKFEEQMRNIVERGTYSGGDSNRQARVGRNATLKIFRCLQNFVIRHNSYSEDAYQTFVRDMGTMAFNELNTFGFCLGVSTMVDNERRTMLRNLTEKFHGISKELLNARSVLNEKPPTPKTTTMTTGQASSESPTSETLVLSLIDRIDNHRLKAIKLLNDTDAYEMAATMPSNVADILKFYDDLGSLFRNGSLATYMCAVDPGPGQCEIYALPNGSTPLKKSAVKLIFDVFNVTQFGYSLLKDEYGQVETYIAMNIVDNWFSSHAASTACHNELFNLFSALALASLCLGIRRMDAGERDLYRNRLSERVRGIMKRLDDARSVFKEEPPTKPTAPSKESTSPPFSTPELPSSEAVQTEVTNALACRKF